jgi:hypothetical protein
MKHMLCRNRVEDYQTWRSVFDSHATAQREAGMRVLHVWRSTEDQNNVFFLFEIDSIEAVNDFMSRPIAEEGREQSGVIDGEYHFLDAADR